MEFRLALNSKGVHGIPTREIVVEESMNGKYLRHEVRRSFEGSVNDEVISIL